MSSTEVSMWRAVRNSPFSFLTASSRFACAYSGEESGKAKPQKLKALLEAKICVTSCEYDQATVEACAEWHSRGMLTSLAMQEPEEPAFILISDFLE